MKFIFINKNYLIPIINECSYNTSITTLINTINNKNESYLKNVYIVQIINDVISTIIYPKNNFIYEYSNNCEKKLFDYTKINISYSFNNNVLINNHFDYRLLINNYSTDNTINFNINQQYYNNINIIDENLENNIYNQQNNEIIEDNEQKDKELLLIKSCEEVFDLHVKEQANLKKLELNLKSINNKIDKLNKQKNDKIFDNILKLKNDYRTWKKLKYVINNNDDLLKDINELEKTEIKNIPILFIAKYNYFDNILINEKITNLLIEINNLDLETIFIENKLENLTNIIKFSEEYVKISKKLHFKFDHDWDYLEEESNVNSSNNSLFG